MEKESSLGRPSKFLSKERILAAMSKTGSNRAAARYCNVTFNTYKKYAKLYKDEEGVVLFEKHKNQAGKGVPKFLTTKKKKGQPNLIDIIEGRVPSEHFSPSKIKERILHEGLISDKCAQCGFSEKRILDLKTPLIMNHKDGNKHNFKLENIQLLCYNCTFLYGQSPISDEQVEKMEDYLDTNVEGYDWEIGEDHAEYLREIGLWKTEDTGSKYIQRL